uniref:C3H1-type domain-containing protein n=1 Tax=Amphora coffeiformis TaxID=265554 RepID=A0A7S3LEX0_9STRA|mmetsp:Transcript_12856/g.24418  ORF Transcript_12856/g.24418 Transcript_12856/m.24418 type:complete len:176 (-) Transcript_12856:218-745(-)|eukprot:scaffold4510_cov183-Amphora_coffeaeformis.AAC.53
MSTMHPEDGLNAGAATFTPGGAGVVGKVVAPSEPGVQPDDYYYSYPGGDEEEDDDDEAWMEEIHNEMEGNYMPPYQQQQQQALPPHAEEFWFPECRNCACCNGYKHGCSCCTTQGMQSCSCVIRGGTPSAMVAPSHPTAASSSPPPKQKKQAPLCKFFTSPGGCRFGDKCRFAHS